LINQVDLMNVVDKYRGDAIVVPTMTGTSGWAQVTKKPERDLPVAGAMGKASSVALGLALAQPDTKVIVFDADGSLLMNLGSLVTIAEKEPANFYHFVLNNGVYAVTGGQPIPSVDTISFSGIAEAAGYAASFEFEDLEDFATRAEEVFNTTGPVFICVKSVPEIQNEPMARRQRPAGVRGTKECITDLRESLGTS